MYCTASGYKSATETSNGYRIQAEKHLIQRMIALIDSAWAPSSHYSSEQREDILARLEALTLNPSQLQSLS